MRPGNTVVVGIVGMDGCGKSSVFRGALMELAREMHVVGIGDEVWAGSPEEPLKECDDIPFCRTARFVGRIAKGLRWQRLYRNLKFIELTERASMCAHVAAHDPPDVVVMDGHPLVNCAGWSAAHFFRDDLSDDEMLLTTFDYLAGEATVPLREAPRYLRKAAPLVLLNWLRLTRYAYPDMVFLLDLDAAEAVRRISTRGKPVQAHEKEDKLAALGRGYARVCRLFERARRIPVTTIQVDRTPLVEVVANVADRVRQEVEGRAAALVSATDPDTIEVIATTMSGSFKDQRKIGRILPTFASRTAQPVRVHTAHSHDEARIIAHDVVSGGNRLLVSAGGAGTCNAVLEGAHLNGAPPADLRLGFLRKGSADLIGKALGIPDDLSLAVDALVSGIDRNVSVGADVLAVETHAADGTPDRRHIVGFGGVGVFGEVPRFTESRLIKVYKGLLGTLLGDLGPFLFGLGPATASWMVQRKLGRIAPMALALDGEEIPAETWGAVIVLNGDLGPDFPLGRGVSLGDGAFRVVAMPYRGIRHARCLIDEARNGSLLDDPARYGAIVRTVHDLALRPTSSRPYRFNVDGLRWTARGPLRVSVSGRVSLIDGASRE